MFIDNTIIPTTMTMEEFYNKINNFKKAIYITVYTLSACIPRIPLIVVAVNPSDQIKKAKTNIYDNNLIIRELNYVRAIMIDLYFDSIIHNQNWLGEVYSKNSTFIHELEFKKIKFLSKRI